MEKEDVARKILEIRKKAGTGVEDDVSREELPAFDVGGTGECNNAFCPEAALSEDPESIGESDSIPESFLNTPSINLPEWRKIWNKDLTFRITSHRPFFGRIIVLFKKLLRPFSKAPLSDLLDRQRLYNLVLISHLESLNRAYERFIKKVIPDTLNRMDGIFSVLDRKLEGLENKVSELRNDFESRDEALKERLDLFTEKTADSGGALDKAKVAGRQMARDILGKTLEELEYIRYENLHRGSPEEIRSRQSGYAAYFKGADRVLDIGCGRGEFLEICREKNILAYGIDSSSEMVRLCSEKGLEVTQADAIQHIQSLAPLSLGGIFSAQVIEHMEYRDLLELLRSCHGKLKAGAKIIMETQNPTSIVVAASEFYKDPDHRKPIHPEALEHLLKHCGFRDVEIVFSSPFSNEVTIQPVEIASDVPESIRMSLDGVNERIQRLNSLLFGFRDYAAVAGK